MPNERSSERAHDLAVKGEQEGKLPDFIGTGNEEFSLHLFHQAAHSNLLRDSDGDDSFYESAAATLSALRSMRPRDEVEGMLATQMIATHNAVMESFRRSMHASQSASVRDDNLKHAEKLSKIYIAQMAALQKYRGGHRELKVGQVNVGSGGQAVVGDVYPGLERPSKN